MTNWVALAYGTVFPVIILVAAYALVLSYKNYSDAKKGKSNTNVESAAEDFVTARGSQVSYNF